MNVSENVCPACKTKNEIEALVCGHCGAALEDAFSGHKTKTTDMQAVTPDMIREWSLHETLAPEVPETGIAVYIEGEAKPAYVDSKGEFILGRRSASTGGMLVDFSQFRAYSLGLSRRHVSIRQTTNGYEVMDLGSVNGTWLNGERLIPHRTYWMPSGSHLRLGSMKIFVLYRSPANNN